jgi:hypothetical protein
MHFRGARDGAEFGKTWILATLTKPSQAFCNFILLIPDKICCKAPKNKRLKVNSIASCNKKNAESHQ